MLSLDSPDWSRLSHAYGSAADIPALLAQLASLPSSKGESEPWFSIWSALAHQGDVYSASFAAVPHVVAALASSPGNADSSYFQFPAWVEICRAKSKTAVPAELQLSYHRALRQLPALAAAAASQLNEPGYLACALAAMAASAGQPVIAEAVLELVSVAEASEYLEWQSNK